MILKAFIFSFIIIFAILLFAWAIGIPPSEELEWDLPLALKISFGMALIVLMGAIVIKGSSTEEEKIIKEIIKNVEEKEKQREEKRKRETNGN